MLAAAATEFVAAKYNLVDTCNSTSKSSVCFGVFFYFLFIIIIIIYLLRMMSSYLHFL